MAPAPPEGGGGPASPEGTSGPAAPPTAVRRPFGAGRPVSLFTLGTMRALQSPAALAAVLEAALAAGINHIETAPAYGPAEAFLGEALAALERADPAARSALVLTSKLLPGVDWPAAGSSCGPAWRGWGWHGSTTWRCTG